MSETSTGEEIAETPEAVEQQAAAAIKEVSEEADKPAEVRVHDDHTRELLTPGFTRMRTEWHGPEGQHVAALRRIVDGKIMHLFPDAFVIMSDLFEVVREVATDEHGVVLEDVHGFPVWKRTESGAFIEDYSRLGIREREDFLFRITTHIFEWKQTAADLWGESMFAKAIWEEAFATGFVDGQGKSHTVDYRTNQGRLASIEQRYFAIFQALISRKADAVVSGMELIGQRLKDLVT